jgi:hypothetical protein
LDKKKLSIVLTGLFFVVSAFLVYAWATDTDGGYNIYVKGTCSDATGNKTDTCMSYQHLKEYYPTGSGPNATCTYSYVFCGNWTTYTCNAGACRGSPLSSF